MPNRVQITDARINSLGNKLTSSSNLDSSDRELLTTTFALAGEAVRNRAGGPSVTQPPNPTLGNNLLRGFKDSLGPQIGGAGPAAFDIGVDININP